MPVVSHWFKDFDEPTKCSHRAITTQNQRGLSRRSIPFGHRSTAGLQCMDSPGLYISLPSILFHFISIEKSITTTTTTTHHPLLFIVSYSSFIVDCRSTSCHRQGESESRRRSKEIIQYAVWVLYYRYRTVLPSCRTGNSKHSETRDISNPTVCEDSLLVLRQFPVVVSTNCQYSIAGSLSCPSFLQSQNTESRIEQYI